MGKTFNRFADLGLLIAQKCVWRPPGPVRGGGYSAPPNSLAIIRGKGGMAEKGKGWEWGGEGRRRKGREECEEIGRSGKGRESAEGGERARLGYLPRGPRSYVQPCDNTSELRRSTAVVYHR